MDEACLGNWMSLVASGWLEEGVCPEELAGEFGELLAFSPTESRDLSLDLDRLLSGS